MVTKQTAARLNGGVLRITVVLDAVGALSFLIVEGCVVEANIAPDNDLAVLIGQASCRTSIAIETDVATDTKHGRLAADDLTTSGAACQGVPGVVLKSVKTVVFRDLCVIGVNRNSEGV